MREGWVETTLGEVAEYINGYPFKPDDLGDSGLPVIRIKQLLDPTEPIDRSEIDTPNRCHLHDGDLVFSWSGTIAIRKWDRGRALLNQHLFRVVENEGVNRNWLQLAIDNSIADLVEMSHGTTMKHITKQKLLPHPVLLPPPAEQRRIVDVIESVDTYIAALEERAEIARTARSALLHDLLSNPGPDWVETTFGKICSIDAQLVDPKKPEYRDLPHLAIEKIESRTGRIFPLASASDDGVISSKFLFNKNEVVYSKIRPELRKACRPGFAGLASADAYPLRPVNGCSAEFLLALILSEEFSQMAVERSARTKMPKLNRVDLFSIPVQLPPLSDQLRIAELLVDFENLETGVSAILNRSRRLRNALLSDLLSGNHEIPASYDELLAAA